MCAIINDLGRGPSLDAAGRLRTSQLQNLFDSNLLGGEEGALSWQNQFDGGGITVINPTLGRPYLDVVSTANIAGSFFRQTFRRLVHQPGTSSRIELVGVIRLTETGAGVVKRVGFFDDNDGVFFEDTESGMGIVIRTNDSSSPVDTRTKQSDWNLDQMDGHGGGPNPSGIDIDWSNMQAIGIDFSDTLSSRIRFFVKVGGQTFIVHQVEVGNKLAIPACGTSNLPVRYELSTTAQSPATSMRVLSASVSSEGPQNSTANMHSEANIAGVKVTDLAKIYALVGVRLKQDCAGCDFELRHGSILSDSNKSFESLVIHNPEVAGEFVFTDKPNSSTQIALGDSITNPSANTITGGRIAARAFGAGNTAPSFIADRTLALGVAASGVRDEIIFAVRPVENGNSKFFGSLGWRES